MFLSIFKSLSPFFAFVLIVMIFLIWKNKKDKKLLNQDAKDAVEETMMIQENRKDRI